MILNCDIVIAEENAKFEFSEVKRGVIAAAGGIDIFPTQSPPVSTSRQVSQNCFTPRAISSPQRCSCLAGQ